MSKKLVDEKHTKDALKEMLADRKPGESAEKVLPIFCQRYSLDMEACRLIYNDLVAKGEIKEKPL